MPGTKPARETKKFARILAEVDGNEAAAIQFWNAANPDRKIEVEAQPLTIKEQVDVLTAQQGFIPVRGRVYSNVALLEAQARVLKGGKPEIVRHAEGRFTKAVAVFPTDDGQSVGLQNLGTPS